MAEEQVKDKPKRGGPRPEPRFAYCPGCFHERRYTVLGEMAPHRMWLDTGLNPDGSYGEMTWCPGIGQQHLPVVRTVTERKRKTDGYQQY